MNWISNWLNRKLSSNSLRSKMANDVWGTPKGSNGNTMLHSQGISFTLYNASGGYVVELRGYDAKQDEHIVSLHVIPNKDDLGQSLSHIITLEMLRK